jgi:transposase-like protein
MTEALRAALSGIRTVEDMVGAFADVERCRRLLEAMVWPTGRGCPACGYRHSIALAGRDMGKFRARPGLYQCSIGDCRFQFTVTTRTPLHSTKLPLNTWLKAMWLILQSDKGLSSVRLAEALGVSQPTAWRMGHALRLMVARENPLGGTVEIDEFYIGGQPKKNIDEPRPGLSFFLRSNRQLDPCPPREPPLQNREGSELRQNRLRRVRRSPSVLSRPIWPRLVTAVRVV